MHLIILYTAAIILSVCSSASANEPDELLRAPLAAAFGSAPTLWNVRLSPNGSKISLIQMHSSGTTFASVLDAATGLTTTILAGERDRFDISWCDWANNERLLCGIRAPVRDMGMVYPVTRLVAVNADGGDRRVLLERRLDNPSAQIQDGLIDWLPDDPEHVLVRVPAGSGAGSGVSKLNIYSGDLAREERARGDVFAWISDGYGDPRLYLRIDEFRRAWFAREAADSTWTMLRESELTDLTDSFAPLGFGASRDELLFLDAYEGRMALFGRSLAPGGATRLIYAHPTNDVEGTVSLGKHRRLVAVGFIEDTPKLHFFDARIESIQARLARSFPGKLVSIIDEDWEQRFYIVFVGSDRDPGTYYRYDSQEASLGSIAGAYASLQDRTLAPMKIVQYKAADGTEIPAYLTLPESGGSAKNAAIVMPHGGPSSRDFWSFDLLAQFFAAQGYAVLQSNYRGSAGYGSDWEGEGAFKGWRQAIGDIGDGVAYLVNEGIADADRICIVGWSYGGYAALMSIIEQPELYQCAVSIAGVTDPRTLAASARNFVGGRAALAFIGTDEEVVKAGSPVRRADEIVSPLMLFHAELDMNVPFDQSRDLYRALRGAQQPVEFIEYEYAEHDIEPERYRIDMLTRLQAFLGRYLEPG